MFTRTILATALFAVIAGAHANGFAPWHSVKMHASRVVSVPTASNGQFVPWFRQGMDTGGVDPRHSASPYREAVSIDFTPWFLRGVTQRSERTIDTASR